MAEQHVVKIAPSILSADFGKLNAEIDEIEGAIRVGQTEKTDLEETS